ncbi:hypothetical protein HYFRA_00009836 [Hymenoscyphus fraxineus]|uniref:S-adenosyl-L-methionine-dependent methyltransferase n=1 Tax=Hymenoscyphus fraxineus TaxID=746836 RepID=A0A9N9PSX2_9HELO|nr:hypothetical protein HYFRA_00009836 [Hymenoscyphus fraxineus]
MASNPFRPEEGTSSLDSEFLRTTWLYGRLFQDYSIENQVHYAPCDQHEVERNDIQHNLLQRVFEGRLIFPPIARPRRILDCGYGTAGWASDVADQNPSCDNDTDFEGKVLGIDVNPWQPDTVPSNLYLQVDDLNRRFTFDSNSFDLVQSRMMASGIHSNRWTDYMRDILRVLRPGGWCQMIELYYNVQSDNGSLTNEHALRRWSRHYIESHAGLKDLGVPFRLEAMFRAAGFVDVEHRMIQLPTCAWLTDERNNEIGAAMSENVQRMLSSLAVYPFTAKLGMTPEYVQDLVEQARAEARNPGYKVTTPKLIPVV